MGLLTWNSTTILKYVLRIRDFSTHTLNICQKTKLNILGWKMLQYAKTGMTSKHKPLQPFFQNSMSACLETLFIRITDNLTQSTRHSLLSANRGWSPISNYANLQESECLARWKYSSLKRKYMDPPGIPDSARSLFVLKHGGAVLAHLPSQVTYQPSPTYLG